MANRDLQAELELYKEAFFTKDNSKLIEYYRPLFPDRNRIHCAKSSDTLYVLACRFDNSDAISMLYNLEDNTYRKNISERSPLRLALYYGNTKCIQALLEIPEYQQFDKDIFTAIAMYCDDDAVTEMIMEAAFRIHKIDYFHHPKIFNSNLSRILRAVRGDHQDNVDEDDILGICYRVFFNRSLTSRLLLKS
jgi:ankyrin repeat protein